MLVLAAHSYCPWHMTKLPEAQSCIPFLRQIPPEVSEVNEIFCSSKEGRTSALMLMGNANKVCELYTALRLRVSKIETYISLLFY